MEPQVLLIEVNGVFAPGHHQRNLIQRNNRFPSGLPNLRLLDNLLAQPISKPIGLFGLDLLPLGRLGLLILAWLHIQPNLTQHVLVISHIVGIDLDNHHILIDGAVVNFLQGDFEEVFCCAAFIDLEGEVLLLELGEAPVQAADA